ncbi:hypothetical protein [Winogradskya humida]|uniref:DUF3039 domain-containing protein n=1 Tax=Winogradskya humida TaxID=113566 RepID=A0ABQ4A147_9ACTN|nr:hypothetical protein [Actinoplanes humidus]GIE24571.1 hypothetical protein Ahu01nite_076730 [Actinoplanes humidus]
MLPEPRLVKAVEYNMKGQCGRMHAVASYDGALWPATVCGLAGQAYVPTGSSYVPGQGDPNCASCEAALAEADG